MMLNAIESYLKNNWKVISMGNEAPCKLRIMKIGGQVHSEASLNLVLFAGNEKEPRYFLKINRKPEEFRTIEREFNTLKKAVDILPPGITDTFPNPLFVGKFDSHTLIIAETFLRGRKIDASSYSDLKRLFSMAFGWLKIFNSATRKEEIKFNPLVLNERFSSLNGKYDLSHERKEKLGLAFKRAERLHGLAFNLSSQQGDFDIDNMLVKNGRMAILDWEDYKEKGHPFLDAEFFILSAARGFYKKDGYIRSFEKFFLSDSRTYELADFYISDYCKFLGVAKSLFYAMVMADTFDIIENGYGNHEHVPMQQGLDFLNVFTDLFLRETEQPHV